MTACAPGQRIRITQQLPFGQQTLTTSVEGVVVRVGQQKTGSWFAHAKDDKLWIDRVELKKDDGERVICNLDQYSAIDVLDGASQGA
ncbi:MAG: hypothetical protein KDA20_12120 [Phycisphaerales bacterium]|nr:hypothetical protein [Phycisphaerales bacterium]